MSAKERAARVEDEPGHALGRFEAQRFSHDAPVADGGDVVAGHPARRVGLDADIVEPGLEGFEQGVGVTVEIVADLVGVIEAAGQRMILGPEIAAPLQGDGGARHEIGDDIGARAQRRLEAGLAEGLGIGGVLGEDRHGADDQRQFAVAAVAEFELDAARRGGLDLGDAAEAGAVEGLALRLQHLEGEDHVLRRYRRAVREAGALVDLEGQRVRASFSSTREASSP